ncbi:translation elongation factor Ts [Spirochaeta cellobiosiphila]|uniref:translation elongation factor Ts n=1 Tax=Spirochaeta cellobiosiphila TaxID=504483 RepID=UPI000409AD1F|nr:translation elongation factor Ts [Spirochaeta cellobiosiphila]
MAVSPQDVKKLRDATGAGFGDCKKALTEANGDFASAEKILKEMGLASAAKRSGREANEGRIFTYVEGSKAGVMNLSCETDFVAKNEDFVQAGQALLKELVDNNQTALTEEQETKTKELGAKIKENISVKELALLTGTSSDLIVDYIHGDGRIGVLVKISTDSEATASNDKVREYAFDCALHAAAFSPLYLNSEAVDPAYLKEQEEIFTTQAANLGKPDNVVAGIVKGKLNKHLSQICFVDQPFVKNDKLSVAKAGQEIAKEIGGKVELTGFVYFAVGQ